jgi:hypothetical protein
MLVMRTSYYETINPRVKERGTTKRSQQWVSDDAFLHGQNQIMWIAVAIYQRNGMFNVYLISIDN